MSHAKHHYVPKFLLKQWECGSDRKLTRMGWVGEDLRAERRKAKAVAKLPHLYSTERSSSQPNVAMERDFMGPQVDEPAAVVHAKLLAAGLPALDEKDRGDWTRFLIATVLRSPDIVQIMRARGREALAAELETAPELYAAARGSAPQDTLRQWVDDETPDLLDDMWVLAFPDLLNSPLLARMMQAGWWGVRTIDDSDVDLMISDRPLIVIRDAATGGPDLIALPLSPRQAFFACGDPKVLRRVLSATGRRFARAMNVNTVSTALSFVYATGDDQADFVRKRLPRTPAPHGGFTQ